MLRVADNCHLQTSAVDTVVDQSLHLPTSSENLNKHNRILISSDGKKLLLCHTAKSLTTQCICTNIAKKFGKICAQMAAHVQACRKVLSLHTFASYPKLCSVSQENPTATFNMTLLHRFTTFTNYFWHRETLFNSLLITIRSF